MYGAEFGVAGSTYFIHTGGTPIASAFYHSGLEGGRYFRLVLKLKSSRWRLMRF